MATTPSDLPAWALDKERTSDERYLLLLLSDACGLLKHLRTPQDQRPVSLKRIMGWREQQEAQLRPLELPALSRQDAETMAEMAPHLTTFTAQLSHGARWIGDAGAALRFFPALESLSLGSTSMRDLSFLEALPRLRTLQINSGELEDLGPLAHCPGLQHLRLGLSGMGPPLFAPQLFWLDTSPLGALQELESLSFSPNPAALAGLHFPKLTTAALSGDFCVQPDCSHLPDMPALRFLTLSGVQTLRGIHRFPELRHLTVSGTLRDFGDLPRLAKLDCLEVNTTQGWPRSVEPVAELPSLLWASFGGEWPRNYWPLAGAPRLCQLEVNHCPVVALDVGAVNAVLPSWDTLFAQPTPRPLPPLRFVAVDHGGDTRALPPRREVAHPDYQEHPKRFQLELAWMARRLRSIGTRLFGDDKALVCSFYTHGPCCERENQVSIESIDAARRLPEVVDAIRQELAWSPHREWLVSLGINLRIRYEHMTEQQKKWLRQIEEERNSWEDEHDHEKWVAKQRHILETQFRLRATEEAGEEPDPEDFEMPEILRGGSEGGELVNAKGGTAGSEDEEDENLDFQLKPFDEQEQNTPGDDSGDDSDVSVAPPPEPPPNFLEDPYAHPVADSYRAYATITEDGLFHHACRTLPTLCQLMGREPDEYYPAPGKPD